MRCKVIAQFWVRWCGWRHFAQNGGWDTAYEHSVLNGLGTTPRYRPPHGNSIESQSGSTALGEQQPPDRGLRHSPILGWKLSGMTC